MSTSHLDAALDAVKDSSDDLDYASLELRNASAHALAEEADRILDMISSLRLRIRAECAQPQDE